MDPFLAQVVLFGGNFAPRGWAFCDGKLLSISSNQALFSLIGTFYGGDGRTTFALPDLRGRVPISSGTSPGLPTYKVGDKGGNAETTLVEANLPPHHHALTTSDQPATQPGGTGGFFPANPDGRGSVNLYASSAGTPQTMGATTGNDGSGTPFNNMQPYTCLNYIICINGIFPSRS